MRLEGWMGLIKPDDPKIRTRAVLMVLIGWFPLLLFTALQDVLHGGNSSRSFLLDVGSWTRYVVAAPLFIVAESLCFPRFERIILHFRDSGLIAASDREQYANVVHSSARLLKSRTAEIFSFVLAYTIVFTWYLERPTNSLIAWAYKAGGGALSLAGKWHVIVTLPLLLVLVFGWIWRQFAWARFLWLVSRMDLKLIPTHPDQCGGLTFVSTVIRAYPPIAFACTCIFAGGIANRILHAGSQLHVYRDAMIGVVFLIVLFCIAPLLVFAPVLRTLRATAIFEYGALARTIGSRLEAKWLGYRDSIKADALEVQDFSATTDLYSIVANVYKVSHVPFGFAAVRDLIIFTALPFVPVLLIAVPVKTMFDTILKVAFS